MFFVVRSNDSFNFPLGLIKYIVIIVRDVEPRTATSTFTQLLSFDRVMSPTFLSENSQSPGLHQNVHQGLR